MRQNITADWADARKRGPDGPCQDSMKLQHPAWQAFIRFCEQLQYGEIERLSIQDGLPVRAETAVKKIKFTR